MPTLLTQQWINDDHLSTKAKVEICLTSMDQQEIIRQ